MLCRSGLSRARTSRTDRCRLGPRRGWVRARGGQFAAWSADGGSVHWSIGNAHFRYDLAEGKRIDDIIAAEKKAKEEKKKAGLATAKKKNEKRPLELTGELEQTFEYYDRNPATSNPINDLNITKNLQLDGKIGETNFETEFEGYYNRWDNVDLDYFKINLEKYALIL